MKKFSRMLLALLPCLLSLSRVAARDDSLHTVTDEAWFDVEIKDLDGPGLTYRGRFTVALFGKALPVTVMNFLALTRGFRSGKKTLHYKNTPVHSILPDFAVQMGDVINKDGSGSRSIFGETFTDEGFELTHRSAGWVALANHGPDSNGSQFYVTLIPTRWLDALNVVFGKVVRGYDVIKVISDVPTKRGSTQPKKKIRIIDCGVNELPEPYELSEHELDSTEDL